MCRFYKEGEYDYLEYHTNIDMKSVFSWLISAFAVIFWIFRLVVALLATFEVDFVVAPIDFTIEIALLFITLPCLIMIFKRKIWGGVVLFGLYVWYFGGQLVGVMQDVLVNNVEIVSMDVVMTTVVSIVAILISLANLMDLVFMRFRKSDNPSKKVDWFYKNEAYDRKLDERSDKNNYRIY